MSKKYLYLFTEGDATMRELLGGKGANLAEMTKVGLPVPHRRFKHVVTPSFHALAHEMILPYPGPKNKRTQRKKRLQFPYACDNIVRLDV